MNIMRQKLMTAQYMMQPYADIFEISLLLRQRLAASSSKSSRREVWLKKEHYLKGYRQKVQDYHFPPLAYASALGSTASVETSTLMTPIRIRELGCSGCGRWDHLLNIGTLHPTDRDVVLMKIRIYIFLGHGKQQKKHIEKQPVGVHPF